MVKPSILFYIVLATSLRATVFGFGEKNCGDPGKAVPCDSYATTASGERFAPFEKPTAAVPLPVIMPLKAVEIWLSGASGECVKIRINDKANARWIGKRGLDLSPKAVALLGGAPSKHWGGSVKLCEPSLMAVKD